ncbi:TM2 domain-containing protein [Chitinophaga nivalis]|uniref:TM2 domain-containing protein n=1 Tax=Chitinophaga nivalis TaxID=2991709 RepID=A0ABT3IV87_9BACT|nr:TM2 domain-containing protein [Chitinophaga nivalis]MCW3462503.1 TM2 domain-containing protein [Chitinophaga nivalis]MCW3487806.1 TM2 domain-containing protein [Chitinophaga nivalis]
MNSFSFAMLPGIETEEMLWLEELTRNYTPENKQRFLAVYQSRRKDPQVILICSLIGFTGVAGVQRFLLNQIAMGIVYLITIGFCGIGTIIDAINYRKLAWKFNKKEAVSTAALLGL